MINFSNNIIHHGKRLEKLAMLLGHNQTSLADITKYSKQSVQYHFTLDLIKSDILKHYREALHLTEEDFSAFMFSTWGIENLIDMVQHYRQIADYWREIARKELNK